MSLDQQQEATPGAQRQLDALNQRMVKWTRAIAFALVIWLIGGGLSAWQISEAFDAVQGERLERIGAQSSINAYFCRQIDQVGDGVAALVAVSLANADPRETLTPTERLGYDKFLAYVRHQQKPPRCPEIALRLAVLTGADPEDVVITPLRLERPNDSAPEPKMGRSSR